MDLPLHESVEQRLARGQLTRVNPDGSSYHGSTEGQAAAAAPDDPDSAPQEPAAAGDRPAVNAPKADWIAYVVRTGRLSADDAANYTKADLIDLVS
ncbi:hypothetical protein [Streptomyces sp. NPDC018833]|uniref:hypothetical protein n=1 Tax=Streptomyces sp. NPDC018833 TaxID=3365053 RepID=UPI0037902F88